MLEIATYETRRRARGSVVLGVLLAILGAFVVAFFPSVAQSGPELQTYIENLPPAFRAAFGVESFATLGGFLATELYQFGWVILLGLYFAYRAGSVVAGDVESGRMDLLLSAPVSRRRLVGEKFLSLVLPAVVVNVIAFAAVAISVAVIGETVSLVDLAMVHVLSVPYLLSCAAIGLLLSVVTQDADLAQRGGLGAIIGLFLLDTIASTSDFEWAGALSPSRYYDPTAILVSGEYDLLGALVLTAAAVLLVVVSREWFRRVDVQ